MATANINETDQSLESWIQAFLQDCQSDSTQLAIEIVNQCCRHDNQIEKLQSPLETFAHRILQELTMIRATSQSNHKCDVPTQSYDDFSSPYAPQFNAEDGESLFEIFEELMIPSKIKSTSTEFPLQIQPSSNATCLFDPPLAQALVRKYHQIKKNETLYSSDWKTIDNQSEIPDDLLLICLQGRKLVQADMHTLCDIIHDFHILDTLRQAVEDWGLQQEFPKLLDVTIITWETSRPCQQCLIFVARVYRCMNALKWDNIRDSLALKVLRCLQILQGHVQIVSSDSNSPIQTSTTNQPIALSHKTKKASKRPRVESGLLKKRVSDDALNNPNKYWHPSEILEMPVEQLCPETGKVLRKFENVVTANMSVTSSKRTDSLCAALLGKGRGQDPRVYKGFFWRLKGSSLVITKKCSTALAPNAKDL